MIKFLTYVNALRFWPHLLVFLLGKNRKIAEDLDAYTNQYKINGSKAYRFLYFIFMNKGFRNLYYFRLGKASLLISWLGKGYSNFHISKKAEVAGGILLFHPYGTLLDCMSIGKGCRITHNVSAALKGKGKGAVIGENVVLNPCCLLVGDVHVGNNSIIGPGAVIHKDVPDNCVVVGNPAMILKKDGVVIRQML